LDGGWRNGTAPESRQQKIQLEGQDDHGRAIDSTGQQSRVRQHDLERKKDEWHNLVIRTKGDTPTVYLDDDEVGSFASERITHMTKASVSVTT
jgi:hypothetical protein